MRTLLHSSLLLVALSVCGCSEATADVTGTVTFQGKLVVSGMVSVIGPKGNPVGAPILADGTYRLIGIQTGNSIFLVASPPPSGAATVTKPARGGDKATDDKPPESREAGSPAGNTLTPEQAKQWVALPNKYGDPNQTDLKFDVAAGKNTYNIDLK